MASSHPIIIFLDRSGFLLYQDSLPNVWQFPFSEDTVRHLEVINRDGLVDNILSFIKTNKLMSTSLIIILSDGVVFQKDLAPIQEGDNPEGETREKEIQQFLENVPFEYFIAKVVGSARIVATNKELLETIILPFKKIGCTVAAVVPSFVYDGKIDFSFGLTPDAAKAVLRNPDLLKMGNMLVDQKEAEVKKAPEDKELHQDSLKQKPKNIRQIVLIAVFVILLIVLAIAYFAMSNSDNASVSSNINSSAPQVPVPVTPTIDVLPTANITASPSAINSKETKTTIVVNSQTESVGNVLKRLLEKLGLQDVAVSVTETQNPARSSILFSQNIDNETRRIVTEEVRKILPDVSGQESANLENLSISVVVGVL